MSNAAKTGIAIVILIIIIVIGWIWYTNSHNASNSTPVPTPAVIESSAPTPPVSQGPNLNGTGISAPTDVSNASLQSDAAAVDQQMNGLTTDTSNVDAGLSSGTSIPVQQ